jgi:hypothetical protein
MAVNEAVALGQVRSHALLDAAVFDLTAKRAPELEGVLIVNDTSDAFNDKQIALKDIATLVISLLALLIAAVTAYFSIIVQKDDLRFMIEVGPDISFSPENEKIYFGKQKLTFANAGSRSAIINRVGVVVAMGGEGFILANCRNGIDTELYYDLAPFVLEPGKIVRTESSVAKTQGIVEPQMADTKSSPFPSKIQLGTRYQICLRFSLGTIDDVRDDLTVVIWDGNYRSASLSFNLPGHGFGHAASQKAYVILQRSVTVFDPFFEKLRSNVATSLHSPSTSASPPPHPGSH